MKDIQIIDNFLNEKELQKARDIIESSKWVYKNHSGIDGNTPKKGSVFWYTFLDKNPFFYEVIFNKIKDTFKKNFEIMSIHTNGQTRGQDGDFHTDLDFQKDFHENYLKDTAYTCLIYFSDITHENINTVGGYTLIKTKNGTVCIEPFLNRLVIFKSSMIHRGLAPSSESNILRISVAFRLVEVT